ncbi:MAG: TetR/AcrR family transcriptional regulator [Ilumatobacteraceae bacterium]
MNKAHGDETSRALLLAAHRLLADHGADALTVRRIANEANMSTMNVYSRFGGKDGVVEELYIDGFERLLALVTAVPTTDDVADDLRNVAIAYREFALQNPTYYRVMFRSSINEFTPSDHARNVAMEGLDVFSARIRAGQQSGDIIDDADHDAATIAGWMWAACHGLVSLELVGLAADRVDWPSIFDLGLRSAITGLQPTLRRLSA